MIDLAVDAPPERLEEKVPATPAWSGQDLLAHVAGIPSDVLAGRLDGVGSDAWSGRQVAERAGRSVAELASEWQGTAEQFDGMLSAAPETMASALVADVLQHELDLRALLGRPPGEAMAGGLDFGLNFMALFLDKRIKKAELPVLRVRAGNQEWTLGSGEGEPGATLTATPVEFFRMLAGRRSAGQVRALDWSGPADPEPYLSVLSAFGPLAPADVLEPF